MNFAQADKVMAELEIDALVLGEGMNFAHATGIRPVVSRMGYPPGALAIVTRHDERLAIVAPTFTYYYNLADVLARQPMPVYLYSPLADDEDDAAATIRGVFPDRGIEPLDAIETQRIDATARAYRQGQFATLELALARAARDLGVSRGRLAADHRRISAAIENALPKATTVDADDALRRIRPVKSAIEIELMRQSSVNNIAAATDALQSVREGASYRELRAEFFAAAARRGQRGVFMVIDRSSAETFDATFRDGQAFLIDCVSEYQGYHGDYGRTVFIGDPPSTMRAATRAMQDGWDSVREALRPGMRFSDIVALGQKALRSAGRKFRIPFLPHSVGLFHTDHVGTSGLLAYRDVVLEPGMILSVDCPMLESGVGGSAHLEDLMLITPDGSEPIHDLGGNVITL